MNGKGNAPGYEPRAKNENGTHRGVILFPNYSIFGQAGEIERTPDPETAAQVCDLQALYWTARGDMIRTKAALDAYGETPARRTYHQPKERQNERYKVGDPRDYSAGRLTCGDCGKPAGQPHDNGCDMERCPDCGWQPITCGCDLATDPDWPGF